MNEEDEAFEDLAKRQGDWGMQGSRKHQILRYAENVESKGTSMTKDEMQKLWEILSLVYGKNLQAATVTVLIQDGDSAVRFVTSTFPQKPEENT
jgi:hypothetical protein